MELSSRDKNAATGSPTPWAALDATTAAALAPTIGPTVDAIVTEIARAVPEYRAGMAGPFGASARRGVELALLRLLALLGRDEPALDERNRTISERIGAGERAEGRSLEALLAAYRTGARVAWTRMAGAADDAGIDTAALVTLAEAIFVYIDELSAASATGYAREQAAQSAYRDVVRTRLAELLVDGEAARQPEALRRLADAAGWAVPDRLAVAVVPRPSAESGRRLPVPPPDALLLERGPDLLVVVPDPSGPGRRTRLTGALGDAEVYVGTVRPPAEAPRSLDHARRVRRLVEDGVVPAAPVVVAADWLPELVLLADPALQAELATRALAPFDGIPAARREILLATLGAWLAHDGDRQAVAAALVVHPQTVSYRLGRLQAVLGAALTDPRERLVLRLALATREARGGFAV
jgi:hypothetical protein